MRRLCQRCNQKYNFGHGADLKRVRPGHQYSILFIDIQCNCVLLSGVNCWVKHILLRAKLDNQPLHVKTSAPVPF